MEYLIIIFASITSMQINKSCETSFIEKKSNVRTDKSIVQSAVLIKKKV
jgi:hypothetical protein